METRRSLTSSSCARWPSPASTTCRTSSRARRTGHVVAVVRGDLSTASAARDELRSHQHLGSDELRAYRQLACAFVDLAQGDTGLSASEATDVVAVADRLAYRYIKLLGSELLAAAVARDDPARARKLLAAASEERTAIGTPPWPLEPYRDAALRAVNANSSRWP